VAANDMSVSEKLASELAALDVDRLPPLVIERARQILLDVAGLCVAARRLDYVRALTAACDGETGPCTAIGHVGGYNAGCAALINGTAAHGEDFDDTFEGGIVHSGAVVVPAVLAVCERYGLDRRAMLRGVVGGLETLVRLSLVAPKKIHKAGFHPTSVLGAMGATAAVGTALGLNREQLKNAFGLAGSAAGGIIEYLSDGSWTKRMHAGWAAQSGLRAALMGKHAFLGPRLVFEGVHGFFNGFAHTTQGDFELLTEPFGKRWHLIDIAFKPYACGTMAQPYADCARRLAAAGIRPEDVVAIECDTAEGYVHRLWDPLELKQRPPNTYAAKFSLPFLIAVAWITGDVGLGSFTDERVKDPRLLTLASKVTYRVDPDDPYPKVLRGHIRARLADGRVVEERQPYLRGGTNEPLTQDDLARKFRGNCGFGGWSSERAERLLGFCTANYSGALDLEAFRD
jgi:2-methylcitrate dehydratase PrpD